MPSAPAAAVALTRRAPATQPMPVCTIGTSMPKRSHIGVWSFTLMRLRPQPCGFDPPALYRSCNAAAQTGPLGSPPGSALRRRCIAGSRFGPRDLRLAVGHFLLAQAERVDHLTDPAQLVVGRQAGRRHVGRHSEREAG